MYFLGRVFIILLAILAALVVLDTCGLALGVKVINDTNSAIQRVSQPVVANPPVYQPAPAAPAAPPVVTNPPAVAPAAPAGSWFQDVTVFANDAGGTKVLLPRPGKYHIEVIDGSYETGGNTPTRTAVGVIKGDGPIQAFGQWNEPVADYYVGSGYWKAQPSATDNMEGTLTIVAIDDRSANAYAYKDNVGQETVRVQQVGN